jgi:ornithine carbamoyltransferase
MIVSYPRLGINLQIATPERYEVDEEIVRLAVEGIKKEEGKGRLELGHDPEKAVKGADVVVTDTWWVILFPMIGK